MRKPAPLIFRLAADKGARELDGAWMIGDSADADIGGAHRAGLRSIWLHRDRCWPAADFRPTHIVDTCVQAITTVMTGRATGVG